MLVQTAPRVVCSRRSSVSAVLVITISALSSLSHAIEDVADARIVPFDRASLPASCMPAQLVALDAASLATLSEITADDFGRFDMRFAMPTAQLQSIVIGDLVFVPPNALLPTGHMGPILEVTLGASDITLSTRRERFAGAQAPAAGSVELIAGLPPSGLSRTCTEIVPGTDTDFDFEPDSGAAVLKCSGNSGGEQGFRFQIADGVEINGLLSVSPFEFDGDIEVSNFVLDSARITNTGRLSFSGEISALSDTVLPDTPYQIASFQVASYLLQIPDVGTLTAVLDATVFVGACGSIAAGTRTGLSSTAATVLGFEVDGSGQVNLISELADTSVQISPPTLDGDTAADVTLYGGGVLTLRVDLLVAGFVPLAGAEIELTARGNMRVQVDPGADPWWQVSGRPEVYVDLTPELFTADLAQYDFQIVAPPEHVFFTANSEFPFDLPAVSQRGSGAREAGTALRWSRAYLSDQVYTTNATSPTADGGAIVVGQSPAFGTALKTDYLGNRIWQRRYAGGFIATSGRELEGGGYLVAGLRSGNLWLMRMDAAGDTIWSREYDAAGGIFNSVAIVQASNGRAVLGGEFLSDPPELDRGPWAARVSPNGDVVWARRYGQSDFGEKILGVTGTADGGLVLVGETDQTPPGPILANSNAYTLRIAGDGNVGWSNVWASSSVDRLYAVTQAEDGGYLVAGVTGGTALDAAPRGLLIRYDADVTAAPTAARWVRGFGPRVDVTQSLFDEIRAVTPTHGGFVIAGHSGLAAARQGWLAKVAERNGEPDLVWSILHDGPDKDDVVSVHDVGDGLLVGGYSQSFDGGSPGNALWLSRLPYEGFLAWNQDANAIALYTQNAEDAPPSYPAFASDLNITGEQHTTALEQQVDLILTRTDSTELQTIVDGFEQVELVRAPLVFDDGDGDGASDDVDNCTLVANSDQRDSNGDGYGNACDADLNNDGIVNVVDLGLLRTVFFTSDQDADFDGDGVVNVVDLGVLRQAFFAAPGPSALAP